MTRQIRSLRTRTGLWAVALALVAFVGYSSCGSDEEFNLFEPVARPLALSGDKAAMREEAKVRMDRGDYDGAAEILSEMIGDEDLDSNEVRLLYAAAKLGQAGLDIWNVIVKVLEARVEGEESREHRSGFDQFFDALETAVEAILGSGEERTSRMAALAEAIATLRDAPYPNDADVRNTACFLAGILTVPTLADAKEGLNETLAALNQIKSSATSGGAECPDLGLLDQATIGVRSAAAYFSLAIAAAKDCPFLDLGKTQERMNMIEQQLDLLLENADKGCSELPQCPPSLPGCQELFPSCVREELEVSPEAAAQADDGQIGMCELVLHCTDPALCFN